MSDAVLCHKTFSTVKTRVKEQVIKTFKLKFGEPKYDLHTNKFSLTNEKMLLNKKKWVLSLSNAIFLLP